MPLRRRTTNRWSGGSVFLNLRGAAKGALIRAAASTPPFGRSCVVGLELWNLIDCIRFVGGNMNSACRQFLMILTSCALVVSAAFSVPTFSQVATTNTINYELSGGWWFDGS